MDFDDLQVYTYILFRDFPEVLARYRDQFRYVLVDEYQDTNVGIACLVGIIVVVLLLPNSGKQQQKGQKYRFEQMCIRDRV